MKKIFFCFSFLIMLTCFTARSQAEDLSIDHLRTISVTGEAKLTAEPDTAIIDFAIETEAKDFKNAKERNSKIATNAIKVLTTNNISKKHIKLNQINIREQYEYDAKQNKSVAVGFVAMRNFKVTVTKQELNANEDLSSQVAKVVDILAKNKITKLNSINYDLSDDSKLYNQALEKAILNAKQKAETMLLALNAKLGNIKTISENSFTKRPPAFAPRLAFALDANANNFDDSDAYSEGVLDINSKVNLVFFIQ